MSNHPFFFFGNGQRHAAICNRADMLHFATDCSAFADDAAIRRRVFNATMNAIQASVSSMQRKARHPTEPGGTVVERVGCKSPSRTTPFARDARRAGGGEAGPDHGAP
jgi:hypothetical protein